MIDVLLIESQPDELNTNLESMQVESNSDSNISIGLKFRAPLKVSQGEEADELFCMFLLSQFLGKDGSKLDEMIIKSVIVPP